MVAKSPDSNTNSSETANGTRGEKRKADALTTASAHTHTRSKRNRYISIACNECKRRKIKCNGQTPCQRCGNLSLDCVYAPNCCTNSLRDSEDFQHMREQVTTLQEQVNALWDNINDLRNRQDPFSQSDSVYPEPPVARSLSVSRTLPPLISPKRPAQKPLPQFHGPTSSTYGFDVARSSLQTMGITPTVTEDGGMSRQQSRPASPMRSAQLNLNKDPIWLIDQDEAMRLCHIYEEEIHIMYPILDMDKLYNHVGMLYSFIGAALRNRLSVGDLPGDDAIDDDQTTALKLVLACAAIVDGQGRSDLGQSLYDSAKLATNIILVGPLSLKSITFLVLTASFHFQKDEESQAWRFIGIAGRLCIEMGLHRQDALLRSFPNEADYQFALRLFWVVYALDRRWSFGTGMPFVLQDTDIDPDLPEPDDSFPYLKYITKHNKIATKIWQHNATFESASKTKTDEINFLDFQIVQWYQQLPESLKFFDNNVSRENEISDRGLRRLRFLMYLRKNQARISIYRPIMHSATSIMQNRTHAETIVNIAKDTINVITSVNQTSDIYQTQQVCYNYFLVQALAAIFLAVAHAPAMFCQSTRTEFYEAIGLIKGFSTKSHTSKRLWRTIRGLKDMGDKIGMLDRPGGSGGGSGAVGDEDQDAAHSDAAVAMAGLAGHKIDSFAFNNGNGNGNSNSRNGNGISTRGEELAISPQDGQQMGNELTALFEMAGAYGSGYSGGGGGGGNGNSLENQKAGFGNGFSSSAITGLSNDAQIVDGDSFNAFFGNEPEFTRLMNDLF